MKKVMVVIFVFSCILANVAYSQDSQVLSRALAEIAEYLDGRITGNSTVVVLNFKSDHQSLSEYIINELIYNIVSFGNLVVVDRQNLDILQQEMDFQLSGDVSDESAQAIGKKLGAQSIVSGEVYPFGRIYRLQVRAISVETAAIQGSINKNIAVDNTLRTLIGNTGNSFLSIGGGLILGGAFTSYTQEYNVNNSYGHSEYTQTGSRSEFDIGAFAFFDAKYVELNIELYSGSGSQRSSWTYTYFWTLGDKGSDSGNNSSDQSSILLNIGILGKYPFNINDFTFFPVLGIDYQIFLSLKNNGTEITGDLSGNNAIWIKLGGGIDYEITHSLFIRGEFLWGFKINSKYENENVTDNYFKYFTHGPTIKIGIGYTF
jgi:TolB-like protein